MNSFRDPAGSLCAIGDRILRVVAFGASDLQGFLSSNTARKYTAAGTVVRTSILTDSQAADALADPDLRSVYDALNAKTLVEHERIPFPSYPYEWPAEMLHAAGVLTLNLARDLRQ